MSENETRAEKFGRLYLQLDTRAQKMVAVYMHLLEHDREFRKMPKEEQRALLDRWFEDKTAA